MAGLSYYVSGYNAMIKAAYQYLKFPNDPSKIKTNEYTLALNINY